MFGRRHSTLSVCELEARETRHTTKHDPVLTEHSTRPCRPGLSLKRYWSYIRYVVHVVHHDDLMAPSPTRPIFDTSCTCSHHQATAYTTPVCSLRLAQHGSSKSISHFIPPKGSVCVLRESGLEVPHELRAEHTTPCSGVSAVNSWVV